MEIRFHWRILYQISDASCMRGEPDGGDEKEQVADNGGERAAGQLAAEMLPLLPVSSSSAQFQLATLVLELATLPHWQHS